MSRNNASFPERGRTVYDGGAIDLNNLQHGHLLGQTKDFEDVDWGSASEVKPPRIGARKVRCMLVRNGTGITLYGKRLVKVNPVTNVITGYANATAEECFPLDEFLPAGGVPAGDVCWVVVSGPAVVRTPMSGQTADIAVGDFVTALTINGNSTAAGTTGTPGRLDSISVTALTTAAQGLAVVSHARHDFKALTARTTGETNSDLLVDVGRPMNMF